VEKKKKKSKKKAAGRIEEGREKAVERPPHVEKPSTAEQLSAARTAAEPPSVMEKPKKVEMPRHIEKPFAAEKLSAEKTSAEAPTVIAKPKTVAGLPTIEKKAKERSGGIKKEYITGGKICKATFRLPEEAAPEAREVTIVGDFNNWDRESSHLEKLKNGDFTITLDIDAGREYRFRYLIDGQRWENDWCADRYDKSPYGCEDSVVCA
jgi:Carbohydrate-binding module 48 (Isoamylase N-terminal domain)